MKNTATNKEFRQSRKIRGGVMNAIMGNNSTLPVVGMGGTILHHSDRDCVEVIEVSKDYKTVKCEHLDAEWDKTQKGGVGHQNWILKPTGRFFTVVWKWNAWREVSTRIVFTPEFVEKTAKAGFFSPGAYLLKNDPEMHKKVYAVDTERYDAFPQEVIEGITKEKNEYSPISILWGKKDYHYDWEF